MSSDIIDHLAGLGPGDPLARIRDGRPAARENAQNSHDALFSPTETADFSLVERHAVAVFMAALHEDERAVALHAEHLAPDLVAAITAEAARGAGQGPYGVYPSPALNAENTPGPIFRLAAPARATLGARLSAALEHAHMLVYRPREADGAALQALLDAGWSTTGIVTLSQLVAFMSYQLRVAAGLRTLAAAGVN